MKMNSGTDSRTYSVIRSNIFWVRMYSGPVPGFFVRSPSPKLNGFVSSAGSNFMTSTSAARQADARPSGIPIARRTMRPRTRTSEIVPTSISRLPPHA